MPSQSNAVAGDSREDRGARDGQAGAAKAETRTGEAAGSKGTGGTMGEAVGEAKGGAKGQEAVEKEEEEDSDEVLFARALFNVREFRRAAHVLEGVGGRRALFLRCYALYLEVLLVRALFDVRESRRAAHVLEGVEGKRALFLCGYALCLVFAPSGRREVQGRDHSKDVLSAADPSGNQPAATAHTPTCPPIIPPSLMNLPPHTVQAGEKRKEEIILETSSQQQTLPGTNQQQQQIPFPAHPTSSSPDNPASPVANPELPRVQAELERERGAGRLDAWGKYLLGVVLAQRGREGEARGVLCESVREYPLNWAAWQQIEVRKVYPWK
ncbi:unnamed protein product [Closterium sp. NIES-53]